MEHCEISDSKHQISGCRVSDVRCQERKTKKLKAETQDLVIVICYLKLSFIQVLQHSNTPTLQEWGFD
jgi:hypothetical protein